MTIRIVKDVKEFADLKKSWDLLLDQCPRATVFNSWEWLYLWWKHYGDGNRLRILVVAKETETIAIVPLYIREEKPLGLFSVGILQFIGTGGDTSPDYLDLLCVPGDEAEICKMLASYILTDWAEWDALKWTDMSEGSPLYHEIARQAAIGFRAETGVCSRISQLKLPGDWERFMTGLTSKKRTKIRSRRRHMETDANGRFFVWQDGASLDQALNTLIQLHHGRWVGRLKQYAFSSAAYRDFHRDILHAFHARKWLRLYCLAIGDETIAMDYCYRFRGVVMQFQRGFSSEYYDQSPGFVLMCYTFEDAINEGNSLFDFLKGDYAHKREFETQSVMTRYVKCYRGTWRAKAYRMLKSGRSTLASMVKSASFKQVRNS